MSIRRAPKKPTRHHIADAARYMKAGASLELTARLLLGSHADEFFRWLSIGADPTVEPQILRRKPFKDLLGAVDRASAECELRQVVTLQKGGQPRWAAWWLARRRPQEWGAKTTVESQVPMTTKQGAIVMLPAPMAEQIRALKSAPYTDPRHELPEGDEPAPEPSEG